MDSSQTRPHESRIRDPQEPLIESRPFALVHGRHDPSDVGLFEIYQPSYPGFDRLKIRWEDGPVGDEQIEQFSVRHTYPAYSGSSFSSPNCMRPTGIRNGHLNVRRLGSVKIT